MTSETMPSEEDIRALVGHEFPGGRYTIAHWENFLLTDCTGSGQLAGGMVHPVALFHVPILGAGTSIGEMFRLGQAGPGVSIGIESYDWEFFRPLREETEYDITGRISAAERQRRDARVFDRIQFQFDLHDQGEHIARSTVTWHYRR